MKFFDIRAALKVFRLFGAVNQLLAFYEWEIFGFAIRESEFKRR